MSAFLGIDVSKATFDCVLLVHKQSVYQQFCNTPAGYDLLRAWMAEQGADQVHLAMEATGRYGDALALALHRAGFTISRINPRYIKAFGQSLGQQHKTDKQDAYLIAQFCQERRPEPWTPTSPQLEQVKQQTRHLQNLKTNHQQERNRLQSGLTDVFVKQTIQAHIDFLDAQIALLEKSIHATIKADRSLWHDYKLLLTIPAIGPKTAPILLAEIGDVRRFDRADQLIAYAGLNPRHFQSGSSVHRASHISKQGNAHLRRSLYMPAMGAPRWNPRCHHLEQRLLKQGKSGKVIITANMHLLLRLAYGVLKHQRPFDPQHLTKQAIAA